MKSFKAIASISLCFMMFFYGTARVQHGAKGINHAAPKFELKDGDRVVFLGNSLFENDLEFGYIEFALSSRWADREITFRNLGWSGDTVFGEARGYYTNPPGPYDLLIRQIKEARPTLVFLAYGAIESERGEAGIPSFEKGLNRLLDSIQHMDAQAILLSPLPVLTDATSEKLLHRNKDLALYSAVLSRTATERHLLFVDIFNPFKEIQKVHRVTGEGVHLNETGYFHLASVLEKGLGLDPRDLSINIDLSDKEIGSNIPAEILDADPKTGRLIFSVKEDILPVPPPFSERGIYKGGRRIQIEGLKRGYYTLSVDGYQVKTASAKKWADGLEIRQGPSFDLAARLRELIIKKNSLFFQKYRPPNRTYILGFRSYEQGRHVQGLEDLGIIIIWLEGQINATRSPQPSTYQLTPAL